ncbi:DUF2510 domain-containing protein, partial [Streptacidiphilus carbonis]|uniref:DUF2510 domain-containing protein n=1 Tax=Streptacidiphilus carbonis TaxID=105422 RepID=UPI0005AA1B52
MTAVPPSAGPETDPSAGYYPDPSIPGFVRYWDGLGWLPGTSRPAPGPGEVLPPPRAAARPGGPTMRFVPPPVRAGRPETGQAPDDAEVALPEPEPGPEPEPEPFVPQRTLPRLGAAVEQSGPFFLDETGTLPEPRAAGPLAEVKAVADADADAEVEVEVEVQAVPEAEKVSDSRWIADAAQQRGLMETGAAPRWVSWGVSEHPAAETPAPVPPTPTLPPGRQPTPAPAPAAALPAAPVPTPAPTPAPAP